MNDLQSLSRFQIWLLVWVMNSIPFFVKEMHLIYIFFKQPIRNPCRDERIGLIPSVECLGVAIFSGFLYWQRNCCKLIIKHSKIKKNRIIRTKNMRCHSPACHVDSLTFYWKYIMVFRMKLKTRLRLSCSVACTFIKKNCKTIILKEGEPWG